MENKKTKAANQPTEIKLLVNEIVQISTDRSAKDIGTFRNSHQNAEAINYPNRTRLYDLYADVMLDGHLFGIINKRFDTVLNKKISFRNADKEVELMDDIINTNEFRNLIKILLQSQLYGISGVEFIPGPKFDFKEIPRKHIKPEMGIIAINQSEYEGIAYKDLSLVWVVGGERDLGVLLNCSFYALIKKGNFSDWAQYSEIFGQPVRVGKYDANDDKTRIELKKALVEAGGSLAIMIPKQAEFEILDGKISNGDGQLQERLKNACNDEMSIVILGNTETTSSNHGGSNAKSKTHQEQQQEISKSDLTFVLNLLNSEKFLSILKSYGLPIADGKFNIEKEFDLDGLKARQEIDSAIKDSGVPIDDDYFYETYNIPKPTNYDAIKKEQEANKKAQQEQNNNEPANNSKPNKKANKSPQNAKDQKLNAWDKFRLAAADFFDLAHKD